MPPDNPSPEDPRIRRSRAAVLEAALDELAERGYGGFTIDGVASRSGVARSTVYRLWRDRPSLIADAMETLNTQPAPLDDGVEPPRQRITTLLRHLAEVMDGSRVSACLPAVIEGAEHDERLRALHHGYSVRRGSALVRALADARAAGAVGDHVDPERTAAALAGAVFYRRLMTDRPLAVDEVDDLVASVLGPAAALK